MNKNNKDDNGKQSLQHISFFDMQQILSRQDNPSSKNVFLSDTFGVFIGLSSLIKHELLNDIPMWVDDTRIGLVKSGAAVVNINLQDYNISVGSIIYLSRGSIVHVKNISEDWCIEGMIIRDDSLSLALHGNIPQSLNGTERQFIINCNAEDQTFIHDTISRAWHLVHQDSYSSEVFHDMTAMLLHYVDYMKQNQSHENNYKDVRNNEIFNRFISLVNADKGAGKVIGSYAERMFLSERYLGTAVRQASGVTAKEWIDRAIVTNAKVMLKYTDMRISQIANQLQFPSDSFFCKYFHRLTGITPTQFRTQLYQTK